MKPKLLIVYVLLITLPLVILGWLGARAMSHERMVTQQRNEDFLLRIVQIHEQSVQEMLVKWQMDWEGMVWDVQNADGVRQLLKKDGRITQFFSVDEQGVCVYPRIDSQTTTREQNFLNRTKSVWESKAIHENQLSNADFPSNTLMPVPIAQGKGAGVPQGKWYEWYWGDGLQLLYWWRAPEGMIHGVEVNRVRLLADLIGEMPDTVVGRYSKGMGIELWDEAGDLIYTWGELEQRPAEVTVSLAKPLGAWSFAAYYEHESQGGMLRILVGFGLANMAVLMLIMAIYFYRETTRELREAAQRVNFVNHVSHELKTPLTNIRMYAELLHEELSPEEAQSAHRLRVILSESQRLSRLIANVLTFNRKQKSALTLHPKMVDVDTLIAQVLGHFESSFAHQGIAVQVEGGVSDPVNIDADILEQIVGNLLSNVEKYARTSETIRINTAHENGRLEISVQDNGPGIPSSDAKAIFEPFYRVRNDLTEGVAGTGIGLSIARDLARLHGGDLVLRPSESGAHFVLSLAIQGDPS